MKIRHDLEPEFYEAGFTDQTDPFGHKDLADRLTHLLTNLEHGSVSILDGRWGTGKTVFAKLWISDLKKSGVPAIYFDAFASDYIQDPFQAISSAFIRAAAAARKKKAKAYDRFLTTAARASKVIGTSAAKVGTKVLTLGALNLADFEQIASLKDDIAASVGDVSEAAVKRMLETQADSETTFAELRKSIAGLPSLLAEADSDEVPKQLVVVIDELDRCRPDFALGVLETLKHFFRVPQVHFVLVTNLEHLGLSIKQRYGMGDAALEYLQKFHDFIIHFETKAEQHRGPNAAVLGRALLTAVLPSHVPAQERYELEETLGEVIKAFSLTLRQAEALVSNVTLAYLAVRESEFRPRTPIVFLALLKVAKPELYGAIKRGKFSFDEFAKFVDTGSWSNNYNIERVMKMMRVYGDPEYAENDDDSKSIVSSLWRYHFDLPSNVLPYLANAVMDRFGKL